MNMTPLSGSNKLVVVGGGAAGMMAAGMAAQAGAQVTHVDAAKGMVERAGENARLSGIDTGIRYIVDDCLKFV